MSSSYFPLRWEGTGDHWWYASPIEWAAANGHYDLVRELLHFDSNLLIQLTSLRRIRRLETVWDDETQCNNVAQGRSQVARKLYLESENNYGDNSFINAGYGGWLLYTAASAGDVNFAKELLQKDPLLVFGEGEYGVTDILYAAARSNNSQVFRILFNFSISSRCPLSHSGELNQYSGQASSGFKWEMINRAVHATARGGNLEILKELLQDYSDVSVFRDVNGSTILHAASARGQTEVVEDLVSSYDILTSTNNQGNTALHVAAFHGHVAVVEALVKSSPSSAYLPNNEGDTFLHMAVTGFQTPGFRRLDRHIALMKHLVSENFADHMKNIINVRNNVGRTALHNAVTGNIQSDLVEVLASVPSIDLNIQDVDGMTPLDLLKQQPQSPSSEIVILRLMSAGGVLNNEKNVGRNVAADTDLKMVQGIGSSPGTSFRIPDTELLLYTGVETLGSSARPDSCSKDLIIYNVNSEIKKAGPVHRHLKSLIKGSRHISRNSEDIGKFVDDNSMDYNKECIELEETHATSFPQRMSKSSLTFNDNEMVSVRDELPSPSTKKKYPTGLVQGVMQAFPHVASLSQSTSASMSRSSISSPSSSDKHKCRQSEHDIAGPSRSSSSFNDADMDQTHKSASTSKRLIDPFFCFSTENLTVNCQTKRSQPNDGYKHSVPPLS
ncbi:Ankyrin repeat family protein [Thalictrum thalictroides]|uniref:Ankyrin repeat family protein n=1 Tax=Thalictrum thalictroides TaxID=46969 RepID=A0A7J6W6H7_THATH|nr:Ankyrin repeat family protein [Thalictrum thalictroides]